MNAGEGLSPCNIPYGENTEDVPDQNFRKNGSSRNWSKFGDIPVHGDTLVGKADSNIRFYFENVDGFVIPTNKNTKKSKINNSKQTYLAHLFSRLEVDVFGGFETRQQYDMLPANLKLNKKLDLREGSRIQRSHNIHERFSTMQQGGTCLLAQEAIGSFVTEQGSDPEGLGQWS